MTLNGAPLFPGERRARTCAGALCNDRRVSGRKQWREANAQLAWAVCRCGSVHGHVPHLHAVLFATTHVLEGEELLLDYGDDYHRTMARIEATAQAHAEQAKEERRVDDYLARMGTTRRRPMRREAARACLQSVGVGAGARAQAVASGAPRHLAPKPARARAMVLDVISPLAEGVTLRDVCQVCLSEESTVDNPIVFCDNCDVAVHCACYGLPCGPDAPSPSQWRFCCETCQTNQDGLDRGSSDVSPPSCCLCRKTDGALLPVVGPLAQHGTLAHPFCATWFPETHVTGFTVQQRPDTTPDPPRAALACTFKACKLRGGCIQCVEPACAIAFHPWCALQKGLSMTVEQAQEGLLHAARCRTHSRVMQHAKAPSTTAAAAPARGERVEECGSEQSTRRQSRSLTEPLDAAVEAGGMDAQGRGVDPQVVSALAQLEALETRRRRAVDAEHVGQLRLSAVQARAQVRHLELQCERDEQALQAKRRRLQAAPLARGGSGGGGADQAGGARPEGAAGATRRVRTGRRKHYQLLHDAFFKHYPASAVTHGRALLR